MERPTILAFGHSFVCRLRDHLYREARGPNPETSLGFNLRIARETASIFFLGKGGLTISRALSEIPIVATLEPQVIILQLGDNDLDQRRVCPVSLAARIVELAQQLLRDSTAQHVIISQLLTCLLMSQL